MYSNPINVFPMPGKKYYIGLWISMLYMDFYDFITHVQTKKHKQNTLVITSFTDLRLSMHWDLEPWTKNMIKTEAEDTHLKLQTSFLPPWWVCNYRSNKGTFQHWFINPHPQQKILPLFCQRRKDRIQSHTNTCTTLLTASNMLELQVQRQRNK